MLSSQLLIFKKMTIRGFVVVVVVVVFITLHNKEEDDARGFKGLAKIRNLQTYIPFPKKYFVTAFFCEITYYSPIK